MLEDLDKLFWFVFFVNVFDVVDLMVIFIECVGCKVFVFIGILWV